MIANDRFKVCLCRKTLFLLLLFLTSKFLLFEMNIWSDLICLVGLIAVQGVAVFKGIDRHGAQLELGGCPEHPDGDFAPVGDEQFLDGSNRCHSEMLSGSSKNTAPVAIPQLIFDVKLNRVFLKIDFL